MENNNLQISRRKKRRDVIDGRIDTIVKSLIPSTRRSIILFVIVLLFNSFMIYHLKPYALVAGICSVVSLVSIYAIYKGICTCLGYKKELKELVENREKLRKEYDKSKEI